MGLEEQLAQKTIFPELHRKYGIDWRRKAAPEEIAAFMHPHTPCLQTKLNEFSSEMILYLAFKEELKVCQALRDSCELPWSIAFFHIARMILSEFTGEEKKARDSLNRLWRFEEDRSVPASDDAITLRKKTELIEEYLTLDAERFFKECGEQEMGSLYKNDPAEFERVFTRGKENYLSSPAFGRSSGGLTAF